MAMTPCIEWDGKGHQHGYGFHSPTRTRAHRLVWQQERGAIPNGMFVLHKCDNPACVNIDHLFLGTHADNMADMKAKGRGRSGSVKRKLTQEQVDEIRRRYTGAWGEQSALAREFGVRHGTIQFIVNGETWVK